MALLFIDGFDHYATADITKKWTSAGATAVIGSTDGRRGGGAFKASLTGTSTTILTKTLTASASWVLGFAISVSALPSAATTLAALLDAGSVQCDLRLNTDGTLSITRNGTALTNGTSVTALTTNTWYYIEFKVTIADSISASSCKARINGVDAITVATSQDTKATANASANQVRLGTSNSSGMQFYIDDFYCCDQSGSVNNDFLGDCRIDTLYPNADGNYSQFTPSTGSTHYDLVDETAPNTTDYNESATNGHRDSYAFQNLSALVASTIHGLQVNVAALKDDAGTRSACAMVRSSSTDSDGATVALSTSQAYISQVWETNPNGSVAWTESSVNAAEFGVKVAA
mgnify:CR=1 FL=1